MFRTVLRGLGRLNVGRKLLLIYLLDLSAVIFISGILIQEKFIAIDFARKEQAGNAYIAALRPLVLELAGDADPDARRVAVAALREAQSRHGAQLATAALADRLLQGHDGADAAAGLGAARELLTHVGNQSNLILDPDLDSYYSMSVVVLRVPELLGLVADTERLLRRHVRSGGPMDADARTEAVVLEGRLQAAARALASDRDEAINANPALRTRLRGAGEAVDAALARFVAVAREPLDGPTTEGWDDRLLACRRELLRAIGTQWSDTAAVLETLIQQRIDGFFARMWLHLGTAAALLALILSAVYFVARQISLPLGRLAGVIDEVRRTGDHGPRVDWHSADEIGRVVRGFNDMLVQLDHERRAREALTARAHAAAAQQALVEAIPIPLMVTAVPGHEVLHANPPAQTWLAACPTDPWRMGLEPAVRSRFFQQLADREAVDEFEVRWRAGDERHWAVLSARRLSYQGRDAVLTAFTPINHLKQLEQRLELWAKVFEASSEGIMIVGADDRIVGANQALCRQTGQELPELIRSEPRELIAFVDGQLPDAAWLASLERRNGWQGEAWLLCRDGGRLPVWLVASVVRDRQGQPSQHILTTLDISERKRNEQRIEFLAHHDVLTELPNRSLCTERLRMALQQAQRRRRKVAVLFIDLDRFKHINDSLGHHVGDGLLRSVAGRLSSAVRAGDTVSRLGGDEFVVVLGDLEGVHEAAHVVDERLVPLIRQPHVVDAQELTVSCSVGVAIYPDDADDIATLMRHADTAMYQAKASGRDGVQYFTAELNERVQRRLRLENALRHAVERDELRLHFQPRVAALDGRVVGAEALLRWHQPEIGLTPPADFIPVAEETGLIAGIGAWVIDEACRQLAAWRAAGIGLDSVSVNVSALQLRSGDLVATLRAALARHALPAGALEVELTESALMSEVDQALQQLQALKTLGVQLAIDDFGTGYSSLNYLNRFPIDRLKIDRSFVRDMLDDPTDLAITRAIIGLGHTLGLRVVAEGVEREAEAQALLAAGCDELQGYLYARPLPAAELPGWLAQRQPGR